MKRYSDTEAFFSMPFEDGFELLKCAIDDDNETRLFLRWVIGYQSTITFEEFKNKLKQKSINDNRKSDDILESVKFLLDNFGV